MNTTNSQLESTKDIKRRRTTRRNTIIVMVLLFAALLSGNGAIVSPTDKFTASDLAWGGLSIVAFASLLWSLYVDYRQADERQQLIQLKANSLAFAAVIFSMVTAQILHALSLVRLEMSAQVIIIGGILLWVLLLRDMERRSNA